MPYFTSLNGGNLPQRLKNNPRFSGFIFNNAAQNISPSVYLKKEFEAQGYLDMKYISNTIELKNYPVISKNFNSIRLLWVRSFSKIYNPQMAVKVQRKLMDMGYAAELCMIGPDSDGSLKEVKALAKALNVDVEFTGKLSKTEWVEKSKNSNIFINTTNFDNAPVSLIEAMALGLPIVSTNVGGMPFLIENEKEGLLVEKSNVDAMVEAIVKIYKEKTVRDTLITNGRRKAETFAWSVVKQQWNNVLR
ncbi:glycosyltransferase [Winogradskyella sp. E313]|nr:glycosyltransferase [Winogradskyella immobilis]